MAIQVSGSQASYEAYNYAGAEVDSIKSQGSEDDSALDAVSKQNSDTNPNADVAVTYSANKMSAADRASLVEKLKADQEEKQRSLVNLVQKMLSKQAKTYGAAQGGDGMWRFIASGNYTVDAETKAQAQKDISEDGYWGVKQTSQRLFDFASALAGDDVDKMREMQKAMEKGFKQAKKSWGGELPGISGATYEAANALFDEYYKSKGVK